MAVKAHQIVVVGCPRSELTGNIKERKGVGKSCFCNRFVTPDTFSLHVCHDSVLSEAEWRDNKVYNKDHFLYWGTVTKELPNGDEDRFHIVEQTEFYNADDGKLFFTDDDYITRACSTHFSSKNKVAYEVCNGEEYAVLNCSPKRSSSASSQGTQLLSWPNIVSNTSKASHATQLFPNEVFSEDKGVTGFICLFDPTLEGENSKRQVDFLSKLLKELVKTKRKVILACTKCDEAKSHQIELGTNLAATAISKTSIDFVQTSALLGHNIENAFFKIVIPSKTIVKKSSTALKSTRSSDDSGIFTSNSATKRQQKRSSSLIGYSQNSDMSFQEGEITVGNYAGYIERLPNDSSMDDEEAINEHPNSIGNNYEHYSNDVTSPPITPVKNKTSLSNVFIVTPCGPSKSTDLLKAKQLSNTSQRLRGDSGISVSDAFSTEQCLNTSQRPPDDTGISVVSTFSTEPSLIVSKNTRDNTKIFTSPSKKVCGTSSDKVKEIEDFKQSSKDNLRGVIPAGSTLFLLRGTSQPQYFNWEKYGLTLFASEGILHPSETCEVAITALAGGEFKFPKDSELVSAVYAISISKPLLKPLTINIQHCVALETPEQCNSLQFVRAPLNNMIPPYQFEVLLGGHFTTESQYGSISHTKFSLFGISRLMEDNTYSEEHSTSDEEDGSSQENEDPPNNEDSETNNDMDQIPNDNNLQLSGLRRHHHGEQKMDKLNTKLVTKEDRLTELRQQLSQKEKIIAIQEKLLNYFTQEQLIGHTLDPISCVPKLEIVLKPVQEDWEKLGLHLNIQQSVLNNIRSKRDSAEQIKFVLKEWAAKEGRLTQIEVALVHLGRTDIAHGVHGLQEKRNTLDSSVQVSIDTDDKSIQCEHENKSKVSELLNFQEKKNVEVQVSTSFCDQCETVRKKLKEKDIYIAELTRYKLQNVKQQNQHELRKTTEVVLQPVQDDWEELGLQLNIDQFTLADIKNKKDSGLKEEDSFKDKTNSDIALASEKELMSEIKTLQKTVTASFSLQLSERDKLIELQQNIFLKALDLAFIPKVQNLSPDHFLEKIYMKTNHLQEKESTQSSERDKLIVEDLQQSFSLKALDLAVLPKAQNLLTIEGLKEMKTVTNEKDSTLSNSEKTELNDKLEGSFDDHHHMSLSSTRNTTEEAMLAPADNERDIYHDKLTLQLSEKDKQIEELKQSLK